MPLVDLAVSGIDVEASKVVPLHVLERVVAMPYAIQDGYLKVAIADPGNIHGIDELRLATRYPLDIRVATLPTVEGESVVMRLLDKSKKPPTLEELGLSDEMRAQLDRIIRRP